MTSQLEHSQGPERDAFGFTRRVPLMGADFSVAGTPGHQPVAQPGAAACAEHLAQTPPHANAPTTTTALLRPAPATPGLLVQQLCEARREPARESAPLSAAGGALVRPSGGSSCQ